MVDNDLLRVGINEACAHKMNRHFPRFVNWSRSDMYGMGRVEKYTSRMAPWPSLDS